MSGDKLGIMQPYFFPYLGYFDLINCTDRWIIFDIVQYIRHGWMNRNRIHHPNRKDDLYIVVPLKKCPRETLIKDIVISDNQKWKRKILGQIDHYKKRAPYFQETREFVETCIETEEKSLCRMNVKILEKACARLRVDFQYEYFSEMDLELGEVDGPGDWALRLSEALGARKYINPPGGEAIFDPEKFNAAGVKLTLRDIPPFEYSCKGYDYIPNLSVIDAMMFNSTEEIKAYLDRQKDSQ